jgi:DNA-binding NarL/FixJ family response regulator
MKQNLAILNPARRSLDDLIAQRDALRHKQLVELPAQIKAIQREIDERTASPIDVQLTVREREVLNLVMQELSNKEIGNALNIAERTVKFHVGELLRRLALTGGTRKDIIRICRTL